MERVDGGGGLLHAIEAVRHEGVDRQVPLHHAAHQLGHLLFIIIIIIVK